MIAPRVRDTRPFLVIVLALVGLAWLALVAWGASPYGRFLSHEAIGDRSPRLNLDYAGIALIFVAAWVLMTVAMMLPTALPLVLLFQRFVSARHNATTLTSMVIAGYLLVWGVFGAAAHLGDLAIHVTISHSHRLEDRAWLLSAATLAVAGVYQFTPLKYACLEQCRSPLSFIVERWRGRPLRDAWRLGVQHGGYCVGCCWPLMLLMFSLGVGNVVWMIRLGVVMGIEKNLPWGRKLSTPLGLVLLAAAASVVFAHAGLSVACAHDGGSC